MSSIRVANASSFLQERGFDASGIFRLLSNAVSRDYYIYQQTGNTPFDYPMVLYFGYTEKEVENYASGILGRWFVAFKGDLDFAEKRLNQYVKDYQDLKSLNNEISQLGFWDYFFRRTKSVKDLFQSRQQLEDMQISISDLIEIAYYKYLQSKLGTKETFIAEFRDFLQKASL